MMKTKLLLGLGLAALAGLAIGCSPPPGPDKPTFATDIKPIMLAHCVRCHGAGGKLNADPGNLGALRNRAPASSYLDTYENPKDCPAGATCLGAMVSAAAIKIAITATDESGMPPPPADKLSDVQIELITRWAAAPAP